mgnify:CR=1 FL=1
MLPNVQDAEELDALIYPVQYDTYEDQGGGGGGSGWPGSGRWPNSNVDILGQILGGVFGGGRGGRGGGIPPHRSRRGIGSSRREYELANRYLHELAEKTGGRSYQGDSSQSLASAFAGIADELRRQYTLGYYPKSQAQAGQRRQIRVRVNQPNLAVRTRDSYIFNPAANTSAATRSAPILQKKLVEANEFGNDTRLQRN